MCKVCVVILFVVICLFVFGVFVWVFEYQFILSIGYFYVCMNVFGSDNLNGINVKYCYEFMDMLGLIMFFSYVNVEDE